MSRTSLLPIGGATKPTGARPPGRAWRWWIVRLALIACLLIIATRSAVLGWAVTVPPAPPNPPIGAPTTSFGHSVERMGRQLAGHTAATARRVLLPPVYPYLWLAGLIGLIALGIELVRNAVTLVLSLARLERSQTQYLRIRTPQPIAAANQTSPSGVGVDLLRAMHAAVPAGRSWIALTLTGRPDEPVTLGAAIGSADLRILTSVTRAMRTLLLGQTPGAIVDAVPDPLERVISPGRIVAWRECGLAQPPSFPLRLHDDVARGALMSALAAALQPRAGVVHTEVQLVLRPRDDWALDTGWRAAAMRRLICIRDKADYALSPDAAALEAKLDGPIYDTTIRVVAVGATASDRRAVMAELDEATAVLGQYAARSGSRQQRLRIIGQGVTMVPVAPRALPRTAWLSAFIGAAFAYAIVIAAAIAFPSTLNNPWPLLTLPTWLPPILQHLWPLLGAACVGLLVLVVIEQRVGCRTWRRLRHVQRRAPRLSPPSPRLWPLRPWRAPAILAPTELAGFWHLPTAALGSLVQWLPCRMIPAPPDAFAGNDPDRLILGEALHRDGTTAPAGPTVFDVRQVLHLTAGMGAGKSRLLSRLCVQLSPYGYALFDGKGDDSGNLVATMRALLPVEDEARLVILDVLDTEWPIGLNPLAITDPTRPGALDLMLGQVEAIFARLDPETWSKAPGMKDYLQMAALLVIAGEAAPTLAHVKQALIDESYRHRLLARCTNLEVRTFWEVTFPQTGESQKTSRDALLRRFNMLLVPEVTRHLVTQPQPAFSFGRAFDERQIVLVPIPHMTLGGLAQAVAMLQFQAFVRATFERQGAALTRTNYGLVVDEFQILVEHGSAADVEHALSQLRSQGIPAIYAHQALSQLGDVASLMLINAQNRVILQTKDPDATVYARQYPNAGINAADISGQHPDEHQYAQFLVNRTPVFCSLRPLPWLPSYDAPAPPAASAWQTILPDPPDPADGLLRDLIYGNQPNMQAAVQVLASADEEDWHGLLARWDAIRQAQRSYILAHPGCIPLPPRTQGYADAPPDVQAAIDRERQLGQRLERQRWLSRLAAATPRILAAAAYQRQRWLLDPHEPAASVRPRRAPLDERRPVDESAAASSAQPASVALIRGLAPAPDEVVPPPVIAAGSSADALLRTRGRRRARDDIAPGFEFPETEPDGIGPFDTEEEETS